MRAKALGAVFSFFGASLGLLLLKNAPNSSSFVTPSIWRKGKKQKVRFLLFQYIFGKISAKFSIGRKQQRGGQCLRHCPPLCDCLKNNRTYPAFFVNSVEKDREIVTNRTTPAQYRKVGRGGTVKKRGQREKDRKERGRREIREREKENACTVREGGESNPLHSAGKLVRGGGKGQNGIWRRWRGQEKRRRSAEIRTKAAEQGGEKGEKN